MIIFVCDKPDMYDDKNFNNKIHDTGADLLEAPQEHPSLWQKMLTSNLNNGAFSYAYEQCWNEQNLNTAQFC